MVDRITVFIGRDERFDEYRVRNQFRQKADYVSPEVAETIVEQTRPICEECRLCMGVKDVSAGGVIHDGNKKAITVYHCKLPAMGFVIPVENLKDLTFNPPQRFKQTSGKMIDEKVVD